MLGPKAEQGVRRLYAALRQARRQGWRAHRIGWTGSIRLSPPARKKGTKHEWYSPLTCALLVRDNEDRASYNSRYAGRCLGLGVNAFLSDPEGLETASEVVVLASEYSLSRMIRREEVRTLDPLPRIREIQRIRKAILRIFGLTDNSK